MHYKYPTATSFPDLKLLGLILAQEKEKFEGTHTELEQLLTYSSSAMNWIADMILDPGMRWERKSLSVDTLYLTGTTPEWNKVILEQCERSPRKLRELFVTDPNMRSVFAAATGSSVPILIRFDEGLNKVFNGMHRAIAAIRDGQETIEAVIGYSPEKFRTVCEPHVVYDLLRPYIRKLNSDRAGLIAALRYLRKCYVNVDELLRQRFSFDGIPNEEIQAIIQEVLKDD